MDTKDLQLLFELAKNSRSHINKLAKTIKLSKSAVIYRLERLRKEKIILGTNTIINAYKLGYEGFRANIVLKQTTFETEEKIVKWLVNHKNTSVVGKTKNSTEIFFMSWIKSTKIFYDFIKKFKNTFTLNIKEIRIDSYVGTKYFPRTYLSGEKEQKAISVQIEEKESFDELDIAILKQISFDARKSALQIATDLEKPAKTILNRIKSLEKRKIIEGYGVNIDIKKLGREYYKLNIIFSNPVKYSKVFALIENIPEVVYVDEAICEYDLELNVEVQNDNELHLIVNLFKELAGGFEKLEIKQLDKYYKLGFLA